MPNYLTRRHRRWYACLDIPIKLRPHFGKRRFIRTLATGDLEVAKRRAPVLVAAWKGQIAQARGNVEHDDCSFWAAQLAAAQSGAERRQVMHQIELAAESPPAVVHSARTEPVDVAGALEAAHAREVAFIEHATGQRVRFGDRVQDWLAEVDMVDRSKRSAAKDVVRFSRHHPEVGEINRKAVQAWANVLATEQANQTIRKRLSFLRGYWRWLVRHDLAPDIDPFGQIELPKRKPAARDAFTADDVRLLLQRSEGVLHNLIALAAHSGARIDELCQLRTDDVSAEAFTIRDAKTAAGVREVPIHRDIADLVARQKRESTDGYLIPGQRTDRHGYRSNPLGQAFSKLKDDLGFPKAKVFHSLRRFVSSSLEAAGVPELVSARILGHKVSSMSYGVYSHSGATPLDEKRKALERAIRIA
jgi:integrase